MKHIWLNQTSRSHWPRCLNALIALCGIVMLLGGALLWYRGPLVAHASATVTPVCQGHAIHRLNDGSFCNGQSPADSRCWDSHAKVVGASTWIDMTPKLLGTLRLWYSSTCGTNWGQIVVGRDTRHVDQINKYRGDGANGTVIDGVTCKTLNNPSAIKVAIQLSADFGSNSNTLMESPYPLVEDANGICTESSQMIYAPASPVATFINPTSSYIAAINQVETPQRVRGMVNTGDWWYVAPV